MRLRLIRHATLVIEYGGHKLLVDPMLSDAGAMPPIENSPNPRNNPLVPLPMPIAEVLNGISAVLVTHTHRDHWDAAAATAVPKQLPLFCQPEDHEKFLKQGFINTTTVNDQLEWQGITIIRTGGQHGTGAIGRAMAPVSGFVLSNAAEPSLYIAGDTIWCEEVGAAIRSNEPEVIVVNTGGARFLEGDPITMTADDVLQTARLAGNGKIIAVHMEAINHCLLTRADLAFKVEAARLTERIVIPDDGEWLSF